MIDIKVTIFEDSKPLRESLERLIDSREDMTCLGVYPDANNLIRHFESNLPDVVLMDINMPGISGIEAVQIIRSRFPTVRILMQTVFEEDDKIFAALCAGASGYLLKKASPQILLQAIYETYEGGAALTPSIATKVLNMFRIQSGTTKAEYLNLSDRENEILSWLVKGKSYAAIAKCCFISIDTVKTHIKNVYEKLHVHSKSEAVAKAIQQKLV